MLYGSNGSGKYIRLLVLLKTYLKLNLNVTIRSIDTETGLFVPIPTSKVREKNKVLFSTVSKAHCEIDLNQSGIDKGLINFLKRYSRNKNVVLGIHKYVILKKF